MGVNLSTSRQYELEANRLRGQIAVTIDELQSSLRPSNLANEAASRAGMADWSWGSAFEFASKRHPIPTAIVGLGIALWTLSSVRGRVRRDGVASLTLPLRDSSKSLVGSAARVFRERAEAKRREFVGVAQAHVAAGATRLSDEIENRLESAIDRVPGGIEVRPLMQSVIQMALAAALEGLLQTRARDRARQADGL